MGMPVDYTKFRVSKGRGLVKCPKCGKVGREIRYNNGSVMVVHTGKDEGIFFSVEENCFIPRKGG